MFWIVMGHGTFFSMASIDNLPMILPHMTKILEQPVFTSPTGVDTFLSISGFLLTFLCFKQKKRTPKFWFGLMAGSKALVNRYLR